MGGKQRTLILFHQFFRVDRKKFPLSDVTQRTNLLGCGIDGLFLLGKQPVAVEIHLFDAIAHEGQGTEHQKREREAPFAKDEFDEPPQATQHRQQTTVVFGRKLCRRGCFRVRVVRCGQCRLRELRIRRCGRLRFSRHTRRRGCAFRFFRRRFVRRKLLRRVYLRGARFVAGRRVRRNRYLTDGHLRLRCRLLRRVLEFVVVLHEAGVLRVLTRRMRSLLS